MLIFDCETEPLDEETVRQFAPPFVPPEPPGKFDAGAVKVGNLKKPELIDAKIAEAQAAHDVLVAEYPKARVEAEKKHWRDAMDRAALDPLTGRILVIGIKTVGGRESLIFNESEATTLKVFWNKYEEVHRQNQGVMIGANISNYDLPFLRRRSWINDVEVPATVRPFPYRYWNSLFVDLRDIWLSGQRYTDCKSSVDLMARALGLGAKDGEVNGANFHRYWRGKPDERELALKYLRRDLDLTFQIARRLQIIF